MGNHTVVRMCISCKKRAEQSTFLRFILKDDLPVLGKGKGRSAYVCKTCLEKNEQKLQKGLLKALLKTRRKIRGKSQGS